VSNYFVEYYRLFNKYPKFNLWEYADPVKVAFKKPPAEALKYLQNKAKNLQITVDWKQLDADAHDRAFTVANITSADVLQDIINYITETVAKGERFKDFQKKAIEGGLVERMQQAGWTGDKNRLKVIYNTNVDMAAAKGRFKQLMVTKNIFPNVRYVQVERITKRHDHSLLHNKVFALDDPLLESVYPPSGFNCKCAVFPTKDEPSPFEPEFLDATESSTISPLKTWQPEISKYVYDLQNQIIANLPEEIRGYSDSDVNSLLSYKAFEGLDIGNKVKDYRKLEDAIIEDFTAGNFKSLEARATNDIKFPIQSYTNLLNSAIKRQPIYQGICYKSERLSRPAFNNLLDHYQLHKPINFTDFVKANQSSEQIALVKEKWQFIIKSKNGRDIHQVSVNPDDYEVMFPLETEFVIKYLNKSEKIINLIEL